MKAEQFCFWLQGYFEIGENTEGLNTRQVQIIRNHLNMVFQYDIDPKMPDPTGVLGAMHEGKYDPLHEYFQGEEHARC